MKANTRNYTFFDQLVISVDVGLRTVFGHPLTTGRQNPADSIAKSQAQKSDDGMTETDKKHSAALMRINHCGEVCAQALYQGQALTARDPQTKQAMQIAAEEENDHLNWCSQRLTELESHTSYLNPLWYSGSFAIGILAGAFGDKWNLGFLAETEKQVVDHLERHENELTAKDIKSLAIIKQMKIDEAKHATTAIQAGANELPKLIKKSMALNSKLMTKTSYYI